MRDNELGFGLLRRSAEEYDYYSYDSYYSSEKQSEKTRVIVAVSFNAK